MNLLSVQVERLYDRVYVKKCEANVKNWSEKLYSDGLAARK